MTISHSRVVLASTLLIAAIVAAPATFAQAKPAATGTPAAKTSAGKASTAKAPDISGNWVVTGTAPTDTLKSSAVFRQDGLAVTGTFQIPLVGAGKLSGVVRGDSVMFTIPFVLQAKPVEVRVDGVIGDRNTIRGVVKLPNNAVTYPFIARRQP